MAKQANSPIIETLKEGQNIEVGRRLREIRMGRGHSIRSLAEQSKLNVNTFSLIKTDIPPPVSARFRSLLRPYRFPLQPFSKPTKKTGK